MGVLVYILGRSGTGKSFSMRNFNKDDIGVVNVQGKILPFKGSGSWDVINTDDSAQIVRGIEKLSKRHRSVVVDDFQYVMANEFMRRSTERGYDKFTDIGRHAWDIANAVRELPADVIVYILCHTDTDPDGFEKLKTVGKLLDEKIVLEGMSTIVLKTAVADGQYMFLTQNNGHDTVKSPAGMFPSYAIDNDLKYVDEKIRNYYEIGEHKTDDEMAEADAAAAKELVKEEKKKRGRKAKEEEPAEAPEKKEEEAAGKDEPEEVADEYAGAKGPFEKARANNAEKEKPAKGSRSRRISQTLKEERAAAHEEEGETVANAGIKEAGDEEEVDFDLVGMPKPTTELPRRKSRKKEADPEPAEEPEEEEIQKPVRRRGRRRA